MHRVLPQVADCHHCTLVPSINSLATSSSSSSSSSCTIPNSNTTDYSDEFMILPLPTQPSTPSTSRSSLRHAIPLPTPSRSSNPGSPGQEQYRQLPLQDQQQAFPPFPTSLSLADANTAHINRHFYSRRRRRDVFPRDDCAPSDNAQLSCLPTSGEEIVQNHWFTFEWSTGNPLFNQVDDVDIFLLSGDSGDTLAHWTLPKQQGTLQVLANDTFWGSDGSSFTSGQNQTFPFNFVILPTTAVLHHGERTEPAFTGIQTALPNSVLASLSSVSSQESTQSVQSVQSVESLSSLASASSVAAHSSLSSLAALSSQSARSIQSVASVLSISTFSTTVIVSNSHTYVIGPTTTASLPMSEGTSSNHFPNWAIALLVIFGSLGLLSLLAFAYLLLRKIRTRENGRPPSMGSASPMILHPTSPSTVAHPASAAVVTKPLHRDSSVRHAGTDGASMVSSDVPPISGADVQIITDAFRRAMRDVGELPVEEGESPPEEKEELLNRELAEEGRDIKSVSSAKDVRVEGRTDQ